MKSRIRLLSFTVSCTAILLTVGALLVVVGIFNFTLEWDIFGPKLQAFLYGVFGSCVALAVFGVAMTIVLGIQEIVKAFRNIQKERTSVAVVKEASRITYVRYMLCFIIIIGLIICSLALINHRIQLHRTHVFKHLALEQMENFAPQLASLFQPLSNPPKSDVPVDIYDLIKTLDNLSFISRATLYIPDPQDSSAMWGYTAWRSYKKEDGFARFFIAKDFEKAMKQALEGNSTALDNLNNRTNFEWYYVLKDTTNRPFATIRIDGNKRESFREYKLGK